MVASDEGWFGDDGPSSPMTISQLCRKGPLKGFCTAHIRTRLHLTEYRNLVWIGAFLPLPLVFVMSMKWFAVVFVGIALGNLIFQQGRVINNNLRIFNEMAALDDDPLAIQMTNRDMHRLVADPVDGEIFAFRYTYAAHAATSLQKREGAISLSDGQGMQYVWLRFRDDHDRVLFRLAA